MANNTAPQEQAKRHERIRKDTNASLLYAYTYRLRMGWLREDLATMQQQMRELIAIQEFPTASIRMQNMADSAGEATINFMSNSRLLLQRADASFPSIIASLHDNGFEFPPDVCPTTGPTAAQLARIICDRTGMSLVEAAENIGPEFPKPDLIRPKRFAVVTRNQRIIERYGRPGFVQPGPELPNDAPQCDPTQSREAQPRSTWFTGLPQVQASPIAFPDSLTNCAETYAASWENQARLFSVAVPIKGDLNHRQWVFKDGSAVEFQVHPTVRTYSDDSRLMGAALVAGSAIASALVAGPFGAIAGAVASATAVGLARPYDAAWQAYSVRYFKNDSPDDTPWASANFYGWKRSSNVNQAVQLEGASNLSKVLPFADQPEKYSWWRGGTSAPTAAAPLLERPAAQWAESVNQLINAMSRFNPPASISAALPATDRNQTGLVIPSRSRPAWETSCGFF